MQKFTKASKQLPDDEIDKPKLLYGENNIKVIEYKDWEIVDEKDMVIILPYLKDEGMILLRSEFIPTYQLKYKEKYKKVENFITVISGSIEKGEKPVDCARRELYEEAGIVLAHWKEINLDEGIQISKGNLGCYHTCIIELGYNDFKLTKAPGDGSESEKKSQTIKVSISDIEKLKVFDTITALMLSKLRLEYNLK